MRCCNNSSSNISDAWPFWVLALYQRNGFPRTVYFLIVLYRSSHGQISTIAWIFHGWCCSLWRDSLASPFAFLSCLCGRSEAFRLKSFECRPFAIALVVWLLFSHLHTDKYLSHLDTLLLSVYENSQAAQWSGRPLLYLFESGTGPPDWLILLRLSRVTLQHDSPSTLC